jgi:hypothetical protein
MAMYILRLSPEKRRHLRGCLRVMAYFAVIGTVTGAVQVRQARAEVKSKSIELGRQMMQLAHATDHDVNKVVWNGQAMYVASSLSKDTPKAVLDRYEGHCASNAAQPAAGWRELAGKEAKDKPFFQAGMLRAGDDSEGTILCFAKGAQSKGTVKEAVTAFAETGELGALGSMRYVYVRPTDQGNTLVLTAWTDDKFSVKELVAEDDKDSLGEDFPQIPRAPDQHRMISTKLEGTPFGLNVYEGKDSPEKVAAFYDEQMPKLGWFGIDPELDQIEKEEGALSTVARLYEKDGVVLTVVMRPQKETGLTTTGLGLAGVGALDKKNPLGSRR